MDLISHDFDAQTSGPRRSWESGSLIQSVAADVTRAPKIGGLVDWHAASQPRDRQDW